MLLKFFFAPLLLFYDYNENVDVQESSAVVKDFF